VSKTVDRAAPARSASDAGACYAAGGGGPAVYGRVAHEAGRVVLQYWYFDYDDVYSYAYPPSDFIWQAHEGDWEVVNIVLAGDEQPISVGYSEHCLGARRAWDTVPRFDDTHPLVHVAVGSHANYFSRLKVDARLLWRLGARWPIRVFLDVLARRC
jgi:hypothetical protein